MFRLTLILGLFFLCAPAFAQQADPERLKDITAQQEEARARQAQLEAEAAETAQDIADIQVQMVNLAAQSEAYERDIQDTELRLAELTGEAARLEADLYEDRAALAEILAALQRIERHPPPTLAALPEDAADAARAATLLGAITTELQLRAERLTQRLDNLRIVEQAIAQKRQDLKDSEQVLAQQRADMIRLLGDKERLESQLTQDARAQTDKYERLAAEANDLQELIRRLETEARGVVPRLKPAPPASVRPSTDGIPVPRLKPRRDAPAAPVVLPPETGRFSDARGRLRAPATGRLAERFGARQTDGSGATGVTLETAAQAQVIAPYSGRIEFAGSFKHYGNVLIMNMGEGYFITLAGLGDIYGREGDMVLLGEPVGTMPAAAQISPELYIELRRSGQPINPQPWFGTALASR